MNEWTDKSFSYFQHRSCEFFPCHPGADTEDFNCMFCWCPLYVLGDNCGGNFCYTPEGIKDCTGCLLPHRHRGYGYVIEKTADIRTMTEKKQEK